MFHGMYLKDMLLEEEIQRHARAQSDMMYTMRSVEEEEKEMNAEEFEFDSIIAEGEDEFFDALDEEDKSLIMSSPRDFFSAKSKSVAGEQVIERAPANLSLFVEVHKIACRLNSLSGSKRGCVYYIGAVTKKLFLGFHDGEHKFVWQDVEVFMKMPADLIKEERTLLWTGASAERGGPRTESKGGNTVYSMNDPENEDLLSQEANIHLKEIFTFKGVEETKKSAQDQLESIGNNKTGAKGKPERVFTRVSLVQEENLDRIEVFVERLHFEPTNGLLLWIKEFLSKLKSGEEDNVEEEFNVAAIENALSGNQNRRKDLHLTIHLRGVSIDCEASKGLLIEGMLDSIELSVCVRKKRFMTTLSVANYRLEAKGIACVRKIPEEGEDGRESLKIVLVNKIPELEDMRVGEQTQEYNQLLEEFKEAFGPDERLGEKDVPLNLLL